MSPGPERGLIRGCQAGIALGCAFILWSASTLAAVRLPAPVALGFACGCTARDAEQTTQEILRSHESHQRTRPALRLVRREETGLSLWKTPERPSWCPAREESRLIHVLVGEAVDIYGVESYRVRPRGHRPRLRRRPRGVYTNRPPGRRRESCCHGSCTGRHRVPAADLSGANPTGLCQEGHRRREERARTTTGTWV